MHRSSCLCNDHVHVMRKGIARENVVVVLSTNLWFSETLVSTSSPVSLHTHGYALISICTHTVCMEVLYFSRSRWVESDLLPSKRKEVRFHHILKRDQCWLSFGQQCFPKRLRTVILKSACTLYRISHLRRSRECFLRIAGIDWHRSIPAILVLGYSTAPIATLLKSAGPCCSLEQENETADALAFASLSQPSDVNRTPVLLALTKRVRQRRSHRYRQQQQASLHLTTLDHAPFATAWARPLHEDQGFRAVYPPLSAVASRQTQLA